MQDVSGAPEQAAACRRRTGVAPGSAAQAPTRQNNVAKKPSSPILIWLRQQNLHRLSSRAPGPHQLAIAVATTPTEPHVKSRTLSLGPAALAPAMAGEDDGEEPGALACPAGALRHISGRREEGLPTCGPNELIAGPPPGFEGEKPRPIADAAADADKLASDLAKSVQVRPITGGPGHRLATEPARTWGSRSDREGPDAVLGCMAAWPTDLICLFDLIRARNIGPPRHPPHHQHPTAEHLATFRTTIISSYFRPAAASHQPPAGVRTYVHAPVPDAIPTPPHPPTNPP